MNEEESEMEQSPLAKVLVVDDEAHITHVLSLKLENAGYEVAIAGDGEEAFEVAVEMLPDLVITDLQMPFVTGLELCKKLRATRSTSHIPAIMLTARGYALTNEDLADTNIKNVMSKPFSPRQVLECTKRVLADAESAERDEINNREVRGAA